MKYIFIHRYFINMYKPFFFNKKKLNTAINSEFFLQIISVFIFLIVIKLCR